MMMNHFPQRTGKELEIPVDIFHPKKSSHGVREFVSEWWGWQRPSTRALWQLTGKRLCPTACTKTDTPTYTSSKLPIICTEPVCQKGGS